MTPLRILIMGYGKMGRTIEHLAQARGHQIVAIVRDKQADLVNICQSYKPNIAFEFTSPDSVLHNLELLMGENIPTVCGSTGWLDHWGQVEALVKLNKGAFFYASNFSMGMNLMFKLTDLAAKFMNQLKEYEVEIEEIHHLEKKDIPSGTAITLAQHITTGLDRKNQFVVNREAAEGEIHVKATRQPDVPGTHRVIWNSAIDTIEICHTAHNREGFATGAVLAAEWLQGKTGVFTMEDLLKDKMAI